MDDISIFCADIGSIKNKKFGWFCRSGASKEPDQSGTDIVALVEHVARHLAQGRKVALGFECPLWIPVTDEPEHLTSARHGEGNRPWSAGAGSGALSTGLSEVAWILSRIRRISPYTEAFLDWNRFQHAQKGLFLWEAFVTAGAKADSHTGDAKIAAQEFESALPDPQQRNAVEPHGGTRSLIGGALLWSGWSTNLRLLHAPCLVIRAEEELRP